MEKSKARIQTTALIVVTALLISLLAVNVTFAYFTATATSANNQTLTFGTLSLNIDDSDDWTMNTSDSETLTNLVPGCQIDMTGQVNLTGVDSYLKVEFAVTPSSGVSDTVAVNAVKTALGNALLAQEVNSWVEVSGAWYCVDANTGSAQGNTVIDFSRGNVVIPLTTTGNVWQGKSVTISYTVEAIQSAHVTVDGTTNAEKAASLKALFDSVDISTGTLSA